MRRAFLFGALIFLLFPGKTFAATATPFEVSGWIPYWRVATGTADVLPHMRGFTSVMPFGYIVQNDGSIYDAFGFDNAVSTSSPKKLVAAAKAAKVKVVPTIMWSNTSAIHKILSAPKSRIALEDAIVKLAKDNAFDGVDIDFEGKRAETRPYFSLFLKGLYSRLGKKLLYCDIEPRTPPSSAFAVIPKTLEYANDFAAINKYCDRVEIMAYDQGTIDLKLNAAASSSPYVPIADPKWVEKVVQYTAQTISKKKIILGVATYGYEYDLTPLSQGFSYDLDWTFNPRYALQIAAEFGITPTRNSAGELSFAYTPTTTPSVVAPLATASQSAPASPTVTERIVWWSDASAINDKIALAKKLGVRGVGIFKLDGGEDQNLWNSLPPRN